MGMAGQLPELSVSAAVMQWTGVSSLMLNTRSGDDKKIVSLSLLGHYRFGTRDV